jgi:hypothetical protein
MERPGASRQQNNPPQIASKPDVDPEIDLRSKALSTVESTLKNDPMWQDFDDDGFNGLTPYLSE